MGIYTNMVTMLGGIVTRKVDAGLFNWMQAISLFLDGTNPFLNQATFLIDPVNGSDANGTGLPTSPIQTFAEYRRRIGNGPLQTNQTINIVSDLLTTDVIDTMGIDVGIFSLAIVGTPSVTLPTQTISAYTNRSPATNVPNLLTNTAAIVWPIAGGTFLRMTSGPALGLLSTAFRDLGANQARVGTFISSISVETQPLATNTFELVRIPTVTLARLGLSQGITYRQLRFVTNSIRMALGTTTVGSNANTFAQFAAVFDHCCFDIAPVISGPGFFAGCQFMAAMTAGQSNVLNLFGGTMAGCVFLDAANLSYLVTSKTSSNFSQGTVFQGTNLSATNGSIILSDAGFFDTVITAINLIYDSYVRCQTVWGNTGAGNPFAITLDRSSHIGLVGAGQTLTNAAPNQIAMPLTASTTWAAARAATGVKDGATSDASIMVV